MSVRTAIVPSALEGPLDRAVRDAFASSWGQARTWIAKGKVRLGDRVVLDPTERVGAGDRIVLDEGARSPRRAELEDSSVVYFDAHVVVVSKPSGVSTVPYEGEENAGETLDARVRRWLEKGARKGGRQVSGSAGAWSKGGGGGRVPLGVVHRLDKETTGLVVFTRTWLAKQRLAAQFRSHTVHRRYLAVAHGDVRAGTLRTHLMEDRGDGLRGSARGTPPRAARLAITHIERLEPLRGATLVACRLETGRTHQIRIHLSESGHPLLGERVYVRGFRGPLLPAPRLMLHAAELGFDHPVTEKFVSWSSAAPEDMQEIIGRLRC